VERWREPTPTFVAKLTAMRVGSSHKYFEDDLFSSSLYYSEILLIENLRYLEAYILQNQSSKMGKKRVLVGYGIDIDAVSGWLGSYGGEDSVNDISRGTILCQFQT
jgi:hypothetical protein